MSDAVLTSITAPTQREVAVMYAEAILRERSPIFQLCVDWPSVNKAIIERWSVSGLARIKSAAWKEMNMIEAAALDAIRAYYLNPHHGHNKAWECVACRKARTFAGLIGVDLDKGGEPDVHHV